LSYTREAAIGQGAGFAA